MGNLYPDSSSVAVAIRVELARRQSSQAALAKHLNLSQPAIHRRMTGKVPWRITELTQVAEFLDISVNELVNQREEASA